MATSLLRRLREAVSATTEPQLQRGGAEDPLREGTPTQAERDKAVKDDDAFPDGSFPIRTQKQADDAWGLRGHNENHSEQAIVAHIRKQVAKHGLTMPGGKTRESVAFRILLREAALTKAGDAYEATIVREGPGNPGDRNYYTREALKAAVAAGLFEGLQAYLNHPTASEERERPERDVRFLAGHFREARYVDGHPAEVRGKFIPGGMDRERVVSLIESALHAPAGRPLIGVSIDGYGHAPDQQTIGGHTYNMVRELAVLGSADIVTRAGAGGRFHRRLQEAMRTNGPAERRPEPSKEDAMKPAQLQENIKGAVAKLTEAAKLTDETDAERADTLVTEAITALRECTTATVEPVVQVREVEKIVEKPVAAGDSDADKLAVKLTEAETRLRETAEALTAETQARKTAEEKHSTLHSGNLAAKVLREAKVPDASARVWFDDVAALQDEGEMKALVERKMADRDAILAELRESAGIEGSPPRIPTIPAAASTGGLLSTLGLDPKDYAPAA